jgi:hypothetical protein
VHLNLYARSPARAPAKDDLVDLIRREFLMPATSRPRLVSEQPRVASA